jgi:hypothetical protein
MAIDRVEWALLQGSVQGWIVAALFFSPGLPALAEAGSGDRLHQEPQQSPGGGDFLQSAAQGEPHWELTDE